MQIWRPSAFGRLFTKAVPWQLELEDDQFALDVDGRKLKGNATLLESTQIRQGAFWATIKVTGVNGQALLLGGLANAKAARLKESLAATIAVIRHQEEVAALLRQFDQECQAVGDWVTRVAAACEDQLRSKGWLCSEFTNSVSNGKPRALQKLLTNPEISQHLPGKPEELQRAVAFWQRPFRDIADERNREHLAAELIKSRAFFNSVEKSPLTNEQAEAVICFDNRVLLVASAGSGKTSTMVAKAGYALKNSYVGADRMLLLAFNSNAAAELRDRIKARLEPMGLPADRVVAKTFHTFGLEVIGAATGKKPSLAPWVETGKDLDTLLAMADDLKDTDPEFRSSWDMFRVVLGQDLPKFGKEAEGTDSWDRESGRNGFWTLAGDVVKSRGELVIANWLFYNGIEYSYEAPYRVDTADPQHRQYRPDFYIPAVDAYLEHWALDASGEPPPEFKGYKDSMVWKQKVHAEHGTTLLETTMAGLWSGKAFRYLEAELTRLGVELDPNPDREVPGRKPIEAPRLARTIRAFLTHAKSNRLSPADLRKRLETGFAGQFRYRHEMFLSLFEKLWRRWEGRLQADRCIDFEDMLNWAADCIEEGRWNSPYELVMVDEFQDASQARARLVAGLVQKPGRFLFAVGDDWQSINRFAGADLAVMTDFETKFGKAVTLKLETTFRCPQSLCDVSSKFVQKNPKQLRKTVRSSQPGLDEPVRIVSVLSETQIRSAVEARVAEIATEAPIRKKVQVYVLGRYRRDSVYAPQVFDSKKVEVDFITVHSSKGLEADHVIVPRVTSETLGFPSGVVDDPVMQLAMPSGDNHEFAEERRLFYVALTRARSTVTLVTIARKEAPFVTELVRDHKLTIRNADGTESSSELCPACGKGFLLPKKGPFGQFFGCSTFPRCKHTRKIASDSRAGGSTSGQPRLLK